MRKKKQYRNFVPKLTKSSPTTNELFSEQEEINWEEAIELYHQQDGTRRPTIINGRTGKPV